LATQNPNAGLLKFVPGMSAVPLDKAVLAGFGPMWLDLDLAVAVFHGGCRSSSGSYAGTVSTTEKTCPVSKVLNAQITLDAKLE
jgi:hypothetical protein